jgi:hypothetical protein
MEKGRPFLVIEVDGDAFRVANARRRGGEIEVLSVEQPNGLEEIDSVLARIGRVRSAGPAAAVLVTSAAPAVGIDARHPAIHSAWQPRLALLGIELHRIFPLVGAPLLALAQAPREPLVYLQVEHTLIAVMELVGGRSMELAVYGGEEPKVRRCRELVGEACPEVLLAGGGGDLSAIGYELARTGTTWVRILRPCGLVTHANASSLGAVIGVARHASGLECFVPSIPRDVALNRAPAGRSGPDARSVVRSQ